MGVRIGLVLLLLALATAADSSLYTYPPDSAKSVVHLGVMGHDSDALFVGDMINPEEELMMESESARRGLRQNRRYISYDALKANRVPCGRRGRSYYNCNQRQRANPYRRGCSYITRCARHTN